MVIYTALPPEQVFPPKADDTFSSYFWADYKGQMVQVGPGREGKAVLVRIASGNAQDYLDPSLQPGCEVILSELKRR